MPYDLLSLDASSDLTRAVRPVTGGALIAQRIRIRLHTSVGEVLSDAQAGLWTDALLEGGQRDQPRLTARIIQEIEETEGVIRVVDYSDSFDRVSQTYRLDVQVLIDAEPGLLRVGVAQNVPMQPVGPWAIVVEDS